MAAAETFTEYLAGVSWLALIVLLFVLFSKGFRVVRVYDLSRWCPSM